ncbi:unnamed protein product, partial [Discosporangium mesarthrocarpum]
AGGGTTCAPAPGQVLLVRGPPKKVPREGGRDVASASSSASTIDGGGSDVVGGDNKNLIGSGSWGKDANGVNMKATVSSALAVPRRPSKQGGTRSDEVIGSPSEGERDSLVVPQKLQRNVPTLSPVNSSRCALEHGSGSSVPPGVLRAPEGKSFLLNRVKEQPTELKTSVQKVQREAPPLSPVKGSQRVPESSAGSSLATANPTRAEGEGMSSKGEDLADMPAESGGS